MPVLSKTDQVAIVRHLGERLAGRVGLEVWTRKESGLVLTDRDACTHCDDTVALARELVSLNAALAFTPYDLDRFAERAAEEGVERPPTIVLRASGAHLQFVGYPSGALFAAFVDGLVLAGARATPLTEQTQNTLRTLAEPVHLEVLTAPYDAYSAYMLRLAFAFGVASHDVRVTVIEMSEFPILASQRAVTEVPVVSINGRRYTGVFTEDELVEQMRRSVSGDTEPVIRERMLSTPFVTAEQAQQLAGDATASQPPPQAPGGSGLFIPGR